MSLILVRDVDCPAGCPVSRGFLFPPDPKSTQYVDGTPDLTPSA